MTRRGGGEIMAAMKQHMDRMATWRWKKKWIVFPVRWLSGSSVFPLSPLLCSCSSIKFFPACVTHHNTLFTFQVAHACFCTVPSNFSLSPSISNLFISCTTWQQSTVTNIHPYSLITSYSFWCWFGNKTAWSTSWTSCSNIIWANQKELKKYFECSWHYFLF